MERSALFPADQRRSRILGSTSMPRDDFDFWDVGEEVYNAIRAAELAAEGAALRATAWAALFNRVALVLLGASLLLGIAMLTLPILRPWYGQAAWVFMLGLGCYLLVVAIAYCLRPAPRAHEMRELLAIRHQIAALHVELQRRPGARPNLVLLGVLDDAVRLLDDQLIPALHRLLEQRANLNRDLRRYDLGKFRAPEPAILKHLQRRLELLDAAINGCLQQAANAYATLIALLQVGKDEDVATRARTWAEHLTTIYDTLADVLDRTDDPTRENAGVERQDPEQPGPVANDAEPGEPEAEPVEPASAPAESEPTTAHRASTADKDFLRQVRDALGCLRDRDLGKLGRCELISSLPLAISATLRERRNGHLGDPTSLEQAQALREILIAAVERLKPDDESSNSRGGAVDGYSVLRLYYLESRSIEQVEQFLSIANRTVYRHRDYAVEVVARELRQQEARHAINGRGPG